MTRKTETRCGQSARYLNTVKQKAVRRESYHLKAKLPPRDTPGAQILPWSIHHTLHHTPLHLNQLMTPILGEVTPPEFQMVLDPFSEYPLQEWKDILCNRRGAPGRQCAQQKRTVFSQRKYMCKPEHLLCHTHHDKAYMATVFAHSNGLGINLRNQIGQHHCPAARASGWWNGEMSKDPQWGLGFRIRVIQKSRNCRSKPLINAHRMASKVLCTSTYPPLGCRVLVLIMFTVGGLPAFR
ncbi:hypothetical protein EX30DRAFT_125885 [Ascodesmis nigricans]|uniref:Uncharacterized protein n=1 Tax=Ascodesmis nigricans TaxID=341454 RepID=A0A4S2MP70_9PEZI|nr:hypothetical protein EX30DRAFT_125885 [Ascodesmis nigricans]